MTKEEIIKHLKEKLEQAEKEQSKLKKRKKKVIYEYYSGFIHSHKNLIKMLQEEEV